MSTPTETPYSYNFHNNYPMTYDFSLTPNANSYTGRNLSYTIMYFTGGVSNVQSAYVRWGNSPYYFNTLSAAKIGFSNSQWFVNITGMSDASYQTGYSWYLRTRFFASANTISYSMMTYNFNGQLEWTTTGSYNVNSNGYDGNYGAPTTFKLA